MVKVNAEPLETARRLRIQLRSLRVDLDVDKVKRELRLREKDAHGPLSDPIGPRLDVWQAIHDLLLAYDHGDATDLLWEDAIAKADAWLAAWNF